MKRRCPIPGWSDPRSRGGRPRNSTESAPPTRSPAAGRRASCDRWRSPWRNPRCIPRRAAQWRWPCRRGRRLAPTPSAAGVLARRRYPGARSLARYASTACRAMSPSWSVRARHTSAPPSAGTAALPSTPSRRQRSERARGCPRVRPRALERACRSRLDAAAAVATSQPREGSRAPVGVAAASSAPARAWANPFPIGSRLRSRLRPRSTSRPAGRCGEQRCRRRLGAVTRPSPDPTRQLGEPASISATASSHSPRW
jgi:hypothetical protein